MQVVRVTPILNVSDIEASQAWFARLGWTTGFTWPHSDPSQPDRETPNFGSVCSAHAEIFLCRGAQGSRGTQRPRFPGDDEIDGVWMSWWVQTPAEVDALHAVAVAAGMDVPWPPTDEPWGVREMQLRHPDGHTFRVSAHLGG